MTRERDPLGTGPVDESGIGWFISPKFRVIRLPRGVPHYEYARKHLTLELADAIRRGWLRVRAVGEEMIVDARTLARVPLFVLRSMMKKHGLSTVTIRETSGGVHVLTGNDLDRGKQLRERRKR